MKDGNRSSGIPKSITGYLQSQEREYEWRFRSTLEGKCSHRVQADLNRVAVYYYRSQHYDLGDAKCWVDDNVKGAVNLSGYWEKQYNVAV